MTPSVIPTGVIMREGVIRRETVPGETGVMREGVGMAGMTRGRVGMSVPAMSAVTPAAGISRSRG
jgi:hypothetical protein